MSAQVEKVFTRLQGYEDLAANYADGAAVYSEGALLEDPGDIAQAILRDDRAGLGLLAADVNSTAYAAVKALFTGRAFAGVLDTRRSADEVLDQLFREWAARRYVDWDGKESLSKFYSGASSEMTFSTATDTIAADSFRVSMSPVSELASEFQINYALDHATGKRLKNRYADPDSSNHALVPGSLATLCAGVVSTYGVSKAFTLDCDWLRDDTTADHLLYYYVTQMTARKCLPNFRTALWALILEPGDFITITHDLLPPSLSGTDFQVVRVEILPEDQQVRVWAREA